MTACTNCPKGATCLDRSCALQDPSSLSCSGGGRIVGDWRLDNGSGAYVLAACPAGYTLRSTALAGSADLQECQPCLASQYILRPNSDACQNCPPGLKCVGTDAVSPVVDGSVWERNGSIHRLLGCPAGYSVSSVGVSGAFDATVQQCSPCQKGEECVSAPCTSCLPCRSGFYKAAVSADACTSCPADTYNPASGGQALSSCQACPTHASTKGRTGETSQAACSCEAQYYAVVVSGLTTCTNCPKGATCLDRSCAL